MIPFKNYPYVFCDMDGVLVDFDKGANKELGLPNTPRNTTINAAEWEILNRNPKYWENLEWMSDGKELWNYISKYTPYILTAGPKSEFERAKNGKLSWIHKHISIPESRVIVCRRSEKKNHAMTGGRPAILIDDHEGNINDFKSAGGIGILHTHTSKTIAELKTMGL